MSNELIVINEELSDAALNELLGVSSGMGATVTRLKINPHSEDDKERPIPMGSFYVDGDGDAFYSKTVEFRIISPTYQYQRYDEGTKTFTARSIIGQNFKVEYISDDGTIRCGKLPRKQVEGQVISGEQEKIQKQVDCKLTLWGLVSFTGKSAEGVEKVYKDFPVAWTLSQTGFVEVMALLKEYEKSKKAAIKYPLTVTLRKEKSGQTIYYVPVFTVATDPTPIPGTANDALLSMRDYVKAINEDITEKYRAAIEKRQGVSKEDEAIVEKVAGVTKEAANTKSSKATTIDNDLNDEIPF